MQFIRYCLEQKSDVTLYAKPDFDVSQMRQIKLGLNKGLDVTPYLNPSIDWEEMERIRKELESKKYLIK